MNQIFNSLAPLVLLGVPIHPLSKKEVLFISSDFFQSGQVHQIITANSLFCLECQKSENVRRVCESTSLILTDSSGLSWAAKMIFGQEVEILPGIDLAFDLCRLAEERAIPVYLLGGEPGIADQAAFFLKTQLPNLRVVGTRHGFFKEEETSLIANDIRESGAKLVLVAFGMPKQELWIHEHMRLLPPGVYMGVGGTFDVWAGRLNRAPLWFRKRGLEWLFRLYQEPRRWKRIIKLGQFFIKVQKQRFFPDH